METVESSDGIRIAFERSGTGPPLVLVHGGVSDHTRWKPIAAELNERFTVFAMDRRGRGLSGDSPTYRLSLEYQDVAAVVRAAGPRTALLGHSFGAICALEAALLVDNLSHLILYEPPFSPEGAAVFPPETGARLQALLEEGDREGVLTTFYREIVHLPDEAITALRFDPSWSGRVAAAHTVVREASAVEDYVYDPARYSGLTLPILLLTGELSSEMFSWAAHRLNADLPNARLEVMTGQNHIAMDTAPEMFVLLVKEFATA
jgi:pimeloyl-ACP methyl ester carboxylesterase